MADQTNYIYKTIVADMSEGLMVVGFDGVITHLNSAAAIILNKSQEDLIGKKFAKCFFSFEENDQFNQAIIDAIYDKTQTHKNFVQYFDGNIFKQINLTTSFLHNNGEKVGIVVVLNDISELVELRDAVKAMERIKKLNTQLEIRNKLLNTTFGRYLSDDIVKELLDTPGGLKLGGKKRSITVMMSDLRGFTQISESLEPTKLIDMLNHYLTVMGDIISEYKGTILEFLGDGILIIFGAPLEEKRHALNAVCAAVKMQKAMEEVNKWNKEQGYPILRMGIGINTGNSIVGNIGSEKHTRYGVIGKHVNLCSRIESYTVGGQILISPSTKSNINEPLEIANQFDVLPKGINTPVTLFDVRGVSGICNLHINSGEITVKRISKININYYEIKDKHVGHTPYKGCIIAASETNAVIETDIDLLPFTNLEISANPSVFCKVLKKVPEGYYVAFTTDSSKLLAKAIKKYNK